MASTTLSFNHWSDHILQILEPARCYMAGRSITPAQERTILTALGLAEVESLDHVAPYELDTLLADLHMELLPKVPPAVYDWLTDDVPEWTELAVIVSRRI